MTRLARPVAIAAAMTVAVAILVAGCSLVPSRPAPLPSDLGLPALSPTVAPAAVPPDGFEAAQRMAVRVRNIGCGSMSTGSGFALDAHTLVTNQHVTADSAELQLSTYDGHDVHVRNAAMASLADLAIVQTDEALPVAAPLAASDPRIGDPVTIAGYPLGGPLTATSGTIRAQLSDPLERTQGEVLLSDALVNFGSSGSGVLNSAGEIVGVVYAMNAENQALILPVSMLKSLLDSSEGFMPAPSCSTSS